MNSEISPNEALDTAIRAAFLADPVIEGPGGLSFALVSKDFSLQELKDPADLGPHAKQRVTVDDRASLSAYANRFSAPNSIILADYDALTISARLDWHPSNSDTDRHGSPGPEMHSVTLKLRPSEEFTRWDKFVKEGLHDQETFARFLEENACDVKLPDPATLIEISRDFEATVPPGTDAMVIRGWSGGEVHHFLYFAAAPGNEAVIACSYEAGESITYMRGSVGQTGTALTTENESPYGDGPTVYDPANPAALSAGLDFRGTDKRSILTWAFNSVTTRQIEVRVKQLDPRGTGTPELWLNFATNRMHRIMNAGIGGKDAGELLSDARPVNIADVVAFEPDIVAIEFGTNDDWSDHVYRAWQTRAGLTAAQVRDVETANFYAAVRKIASDNYEVDDQRLPITAITSTSVTFTATDTTLNIVPGDAIVFGDFFGDNRRLAARVVKTWNAGTRTATWGRPLSAEGLAGIGALSDIITARVFGAPDWVESMEGLIDAVRDALPNSQIAIGTCGIPNIRHRRLEGYRETAAQICADKGISFVDFHGQTLAWQYSQPATIQHYIDASNGVSATGATSYTLYNAGGSKPNPLTTAAWNYRGWSVMVDGIERINRGCHIYGGGKRGWPAEVDPVTAPSTGVQAADDYTLVFTADAPVEGAVIIVKRAAVKWADDDCHPGVIGRPLMGRAVCTALAALVGTAAGKPGG